MQRLEINWQRLVFIICNKVYCLWADSRFFPQSRVDKDSPFLTFLSIFDMSSVQSERFSSEKLKYLFVHLGIEPSIVLFTVGRCAAEPQWLLKFKAFKSSNYMLLISLLGYSIMKWRHYIYKIMFDNERLFFSYFTIAGLTCNLLVAVKILRIICNYYFCSHFICDKRVFLFFYKTLRFLFSTELRMHCALSGGTQRRAL